MPRPPRTVLALALGLASLACDGDVVATRTTVERDSAGIAIIVNADPVDTAADVRAAFGEPRAVIGEADGEGAYMFGRIGGGARLADGSIVVVDEMASEVRVYDGAGRHRRTVGRIGDGPGEFREPGLLARTPGDTLLVTDQNRHRLTMLAPDGRVLGRVDLTSDRAGVPERIFGRFADGALLARGSWSSSPDEQPGVTRVDSDFIRIPADGTGPDSLGRHFAFYRPMVAAGASRLYVTRPFEHDAGFAADQHGFWLGDPDRWELRRYDPDGALRRIVRLDRQPVAIDPADLEQARERFAGRMLPQFRAALRELPLPATYPPYGELRLDDAGRLWVREYAAAADDAWPERHVASPALRWLVHDTDGRLLGAVVLPPRTRLLEIGPGHLLLAVRDDSDVERVELHDLPPLPTARGR